jgi:hypothetical protein
MPGGTSGVGDLNRTTPAGSEFKHTCVHTIESGASASGSRRRQAVKLAPRSAGMAPGAGYTMTERGDMSTWTDDETRELVALWPTHSASQIAAQLNRSRSAISRKICRLRQDGLLLDGGQKHFDVMPVRRPRPNFAPAQNLPPLLDDRVDMQPCSLLELDDRRCRWPLEDPELFCGSPTTGRSCSYCACHLRMARGQDRRRTA